MRSGHVLPNGLVSPSGPVAIGEPLSGQLIEAPAECQIIFTEGVTANRLFARIGADATLDLVDRVTVGRVGAVSAGVHLPAHAADIQFFMNAHDRLANSLVVDLPPS